MGVGPPCIDSAGMGVANGSVVGRITTVGGGNVGGAWVGVGGTLLMPMSIVW